MARGEYGRSYVGNGVNKLPQAIGVHRSYGDVFRERVEELDAAIQQADRDYATTYQTDWRATGQTGQGPGAGLDQSHFVFTYWLPFVKEWNATRTRLLNQLLAGQIDRSDRGPALWLAYSAGRFNDLKQSAGASWALGTTAPNVVIKGEQPPSLPPTPSSDAVNYALVGTMLAGAVSGFNLTEKRRVAGGVFGGLLGALVGAVLSRVDRRLGT
jgi:hypothetical protein